MPSQCIQHKGEEWKKKKRIMEWIVEWTTGSLEKKGREYHVDLFEKKMNKNKTIDKGDVQKYIAKDSDFTEWGTFQSDGKNNKRGLQKIHDTFSETLNSNSKDEALQILKRNTQRLSDLLSISFVKLG